MRLNASLLIVILSLTEAAAAVPEDTLHEVVKEYELPRREVRISTPLPSERIAAEEMQILGLEGVSDVLRQMGGVSVRDYGGMGGMKTVSIRGLSPQHTAVLLDGLPVSNSQAGQIDLSRFAALAMETVRLHIGGADRILSPAMLGAYSGSVELESRLTGYEASVKYGSWNTLEAGVLSRHATLLYRHTDGDYPFTLRNGAREERLDRNHGRVDAAQMTLPWTTRWSGSSAKEFRLQSSLQGYYSHRELPGAVIYYNNGGTEQLWDLNLSAQTRLEGRLSEKWNLTAALKYNYGWNKYFDAMLVTEGAEGTSRYRQNEYYLNAGISWQPVRELQLALVHDAQWALLRTNLQNGEQPDRQIMWNALRARYHYSHLRVEGELLYTRESRMESQRDETLGNASEWTPSAAFVYRPWLCHDIFVRASWRRSFRLPSFNDLYYYRLGNHDLRPEKATETNLGLTWGKEKGSWKWSLTADFYYNRVVDKIVAFPTTFAWRMTNFGRVDISGIDLGGNLECSLGRSSLNGTFHVNWQDAGDKTETGSNLAAATAIPYTPACTGNAALSCRTPWLTLGWTLQWMGERYSNVMESERYRLEAFAEQGLTLSRTLLLKGAELSLRASLLNAFDSQYEIVQFYPMPGRRFQLGLAARF
jgi:outer membrane cobalamin receptor